LPGEPTTTLCARIAAALKREPRAPQRVAICGVNGGYNGYFATTEEFAMQHYEGASCIWGRHTERFLVSRLTQLWSGGADAPLRREGEVFALDFDERTVSDWQRAFDAGFLILGYEREGADLSLEVPRLGRVEPTFRKQVGSKLIHYFVVPSSFADQPLSLLKAGRRVGPGPLLAPPDVLRPERPLYEERESLTAKPVELEL
jgi:hypothetical protein